MNKCHIPGVLELSAIWRRTYHYEDIAFDAGNPYAPLLEAQLLQLFTDMLSWLKRLPLPRDRLQQNEDVSKQKRDVILKRIKATEEAVHYEAHRVRLYKQEKMLQEIQRSQADLIEHLQHSTDRRIDDLHAALMVKIEEVPSSLANVFSETIPRNIEAQIDAAMKSLRDEIPGMVRREIKDCLDKNAS